MVISGILKLTLLDYPGTVACTVFTGGCNFRCPFCHNASLVRNVPDSGTDESELIDFLKKRRGVLEGVVITGGEPLLHPDISELMQKIKELGYKIKLDTNGTNPDRLEGLIRAGLVDRVAMDIKNSPEQYELATGTTGTDMSAVTRSKDFLLAGQTDYEFRTTVVRGIHTENSLISLAKWISGAKEYYLQQFKDSGDLLAGEGLAPYPAQQMKFFADAVRPYIPAVKVRGI